MTSAPRTPEGVELSSDFLNLLHHARDAVGLYVTTRDELWLLNRDSFAKKPAAHWREGLLTRLHPSSLDAFEDLMNIESGSRRATIRFEDQPDEVYELVAAPYEESIISLSMHRQTSSLEPTKPEVERLLTRAAAAASTGREMSVQFDQMTFGIDEAWATLHRALDLAADGVGANFYLRMIEESLGFLESSLDDSRSVREQLSKLQSFSNERESEDWRLVDCGELLRQAANFAHHATSGRATVEISAESNLTIWAQPSSLTQALVHLIEDATRRLPTGAPEAHILELRANRADDRVVIEVQNTGEPFDDDELARAFDLDFGVRMGLDGLRLPIAARIVDAHEGRIEIAENSHDGSILRCSLEYHGSRPASAPERRPSILIVDDEPALLDVLRRQLDEDWNVQTLHEASQAVSLTRENPDRFDYILCDITMRSMSGFRIYQAITNTNPELSERFIFMTGGAFTPESEIFREAFSDRVLMKPFSKEDLLTMIDLMRLHSHERRHRERET